MPKSTIDFLANPFYQLANRQPVGAPVYFGSKHSVLSDYVNGIKQSGKASEWWWKVLFFPNETAENKYYDYEANKAFWAGAIDKRRPMYLVSQTKYFANTWGHIGGTHNEILWFQDNGYKAYIDPNNSDWTLFIPSITPQAKLIMKDYGEHGDGIDGFGIDSHEAHRARENRKKQIKSRVTAVLNGRQLTNQLASFSSLPTAQVPLYSAPQQPGRLGSTATILPETKGLGSLNVSAVQTNDAPRPPKISQGSSSSQSFRSAGRAASIASIATAAAKVGFHSTSAAPAEENSNPLDLSKQAILSLIKKYNKSLDRFTVISITGDLKEFNTVSELEVWVSAHAQQYKIPAKDLEAFLADNRKVVTPTPVLN